jgi:hypothetical protein
MVDHGGHVRRSHVPGDYQGFPRVPMGTYTAVTALVAEGGHSPATGAAEEVWLWTWD